MKYNLGLFHGRFEHIHKGHQRIIDQMLKECKQAVVLIGNCQAQRTKKNPFTILERLELINKIYGKQKNLFIGFFPDRPNVPKTKKEYLEWGGWIISFCKYYGFNVPNVIYSGEEAKTEWLYSRYKPKLVKISRKEVPISATKIKEILQKNKKKDWKEITDKRIHSDYNRLRKIVLSSKNK